MSEERVGPEATTGHPDDVDLEAVRTGEAHATIASHVRRCETCAASLTFLETLERGLAVPEAVVVLPFEREQGIRALLASEARRLRRQAWTTRLRRHALPVAAAVLLAVVGLVTFRDAGQRDARDLNADGRVDILDAFTMARALHGGADVPLSWDLTGDRVVDQRDVDALAREAVSVRGRT